MLTVTAKGTTDRRFARLSVKLRKAAWFSQDRGGFFCVLLCMKYDWKGENILFFLHLCGMIIA